MSYIGSLLGQMPSPHLLQPKITTTQKEPPRLLTPKYTRASSYPSHSYLKYRLAHLSNITCEGSKKPFSADEIYQSLKIVKGTAERQVVSDKIKMVKTLLSLYGKATSYWGSDMRFPMKARTKCVSCLLMILSNLASAPSLASTGSKQL